MAMTLGEDIYPQWDGKIAAHIRQATNMHLRVPRVYKMYMPIVSSSENLGVNLYPIDDVRVTRMYKMYMPVFSSFGDVRVNHCQVDGLRVTRMYKLCMPVLVSSLR